MTGRKYLDPENLSPSRPRLFRLRADGRAELGAAVPR
jgi:hypothetical protein